MVKGEEKTGKGNEKRGEKRIPKKKEVRGRNQQAAGVRLLPTGDVHGLRTTTLLRAIGVLKEAQSRCGHEGPQTLPDGSGNAFVAFPRSHRLTSRVQTEKRSFVCKVITSSYRSLLVRGNDPLRWQKTGRA